MSSEEYLLNLFNKNQDEEYAKSVHINQRPSPFVRYSKDRLTVKYIGKGLLYTDINVRDNIFFKILNQKLNKNPSSIFI